MTKILGIVGSPRKKGNTDILVNRILEGAKDAGADVEKINLKGLTIKECDGCYVCWKGRACPKKDDMNDLYPKIGAADVIIFGTPVYWFGPTALLKAFIDRLVYYNCPENRPKIAGKAAVIASPFEDTDTGTAAPMLAFFDKCFDYLEMKPSGRMLVPGVAGKGDILAKKDVLEQAYKLGVNLVENSR
ncbi:MAG: flavodoxin family protein [Dehalococcoidia bacterium]|jgi:multimeric flavodoxin WrbA